MWFVICGWDGILQELSNHKKLGTLLWRPQHSLLSGSAKTNETLIFCTEKINRKLFSVCIRLGAYIFCLVINNSKKHFQLRVQKYQCSHSTGLWDHWENRINSYQNSLSSPPFHPKIVRKIYRKFYQFSKTWNISEHLSYLRSLIVDNFNSSALGT